MYCNHILNYLSRREHMIHIVGLYEAKTPACVANPPMWKRQALLEYLAVNNMHHSGATLVQNLQFTVWHLQCIGIIFEDRPRQSQPKVTTLFVPVQRARSWWSWVMATATTAFTRTTQPPMLSQWAPLSSTWLALLSFRLFPRCLLQQPR